MNICLTGNSFQPIRKEGLVTGYNVAAAGLVSSFFRYSKAERLICLYEPWQDRLNTLKEMAGNSERIQFISEYELLFRGVKILPQVDILHSVKEDAIPLLSMRENIKSDIPISFTVHGMAEQHLIMDFFYPMLFLPFKPYDAVICTSETVRRTIENMFSRMEEMLNRTLPLSSPLKHQIRLKKVPLGVDTSYYRPMDQIKCRKEFGFDAEDIIILWFGRFSDLFKADLYPLLHVFRKLLMQNRNKRLRLVLSGSQEPGTDYAGKIYAETRHMGIDDFVKIIFHHEIENRAALYSACDIFTSPVDNVQETFGLTPIEAMACGVPQVVSDWNGYRDTVADNETGFLVKTFWTECMSDIAHMDCLPSDVNRRSMLQRYLQVRSVAVDCTEYCDKLQMLIDNPLMRKKFSEACRKRAEYCFSLQNTVKKTEEVWGELHEMAKGAESDFNNINVPMIDYCNDFRDYPTQMFKDTTVFEATECGVAGSSDDLPQYRIFNCNVEEAVLPGRILQYILENKYVSMADVVKKFSDFQEPQVKRELMFLFKYDMIRPI